MSKTMKYKSEHKIVFSFPENDKKALPTFLHSTDVLILLISSIPFVVINFFPPFRLRNTTPYLDAKL